MAYEMPHSVERPGGVEYMLLRGHTQRTTDVYVCAIGEEVRLARKHFDCHGNNASRDVDLTAEHARELGVKLIEAAAEAECAERFSRETQELLAD